MEKRIPQATLLPRTEDSFPWGAADRQLVPTYLENMDMRKRSICIREQQMCIH